MATTPRGEAPERRKYMRIADTIRDAIISGELPIGTKLPPEHVQAPQFGVTKTTLRRAIHLLRMEGYVQTTQGIGTYVRSTDPGNVDPDEHFGITLMLIDNARDALEELEAHLHRTVNRPTR